MVALPRYYHGGNMGPEERNIACTPTYRFCVRRKENLITSLWVAFEF